MWSFYCLKYSIPFFGRKIILPISPVIPISSEFSGFLPTEMDYWPKNGWPD
jgi:hypothetical protein